MSIAMLNIVKDLGLTVVVLEEIRCCGDICGLPGDRGIIVEVDPWRRGADRLIVKNLRTDDEFYCDANQIGVTMTDYVALRQKVADIQAILA